MRRGVELLGTVGMTVPSEVIWIFIVYPDLRFSLFAGQALNTGRCWHKCHRRHDGAEAQQVPARDLRAGYRQSKALDITDIEEGLHRTDYDSGQNDGTGQKRPQSQAGIKMARCFEDAEPPDGATGPVPTSRSSARQRFQSRLIHPK